MHIRGGLPRWLPSNTPRLTVIREDLHPQSLADSKASHGSHQLMCSFKEPPAPPHSGGVVGSGDSEVASQMQGAQIVCQQLAPS